MWTGLRKLWEKSHAKGDMPAGSGHTPQLGGAVDRKRCGTISLGSESLKSLIELGQVVHSRQLNQSNQLNQLNQLTQVIQLI